MYIERVPNRNSPPAVLLRESFREGGQVHKRTLANLSHWPEHRIEALRAVLKGQTQVADLRQAFQIVRSQPHGHVVAALGSLRRTGLERALASRRSAERDLAVGLIVARLIDPASKLATARGFRAETASSSLGALLGLESVDEEQLYGAMDWLVVRQERIEAKLARKHLRQGCLVLYDVSSSYYTGTHCALARWGYSRDGKRGYPQILYGLLCNGEGCPVAVEVFEGNVGDPKTLSSQVQKMRKRFGLERVVLVGDRGLITEARIREELKPVAGLDWITALRAPAIRKLVESGAVQPSLFDERDLAEIRSPDYPGERLIACRNPFLAAERARKREELLQSTERELDKIVAATRRKQRPLRGKEKIALRVGKGINHYKMEKHFKLEITQTSLSYERDEQSIASEAALDGIYVIRTSVPEQALDASATVRTYKDLSLVERAFRSLKTVDLQIRPIYHRLVDRVRAHVFLCMLAYYVEWHMRRALAPILFDDEDQELAEAMRASVVAPAVRSPRALAKAQSKRTEADEPVHSFRSLLKDLATLARNRIRPRLPKSDAPPSAEFEMLTVATPLQRRALELLSVRLTV